MGEGGGGEITDFAFRIVKIERRKIEKKEPYMLKMGKNMVRVFLLPKRRKNK